MTTPTTPPAAAPATQAAPATPPATPPAAPSTLLTAPPAKTDGAGDGKASAGTTDAPKGTETSEGGKPKGEEAAPAPLKLKLPEGMQADDALLKGFEPLARDLKLDEAGAQKLVDLYAGRQQQQAKEAAEAHRRQVESWEKEAKSDPELGGDKWPATQQAIANVMTRFNEPALVEVLNKSGLGNHPALVRFVARLGQAIADDSIKGAGGAQKQPRTEKERLARFYDHPDSQKRQ